MIRVDGCEATYDVSVGAAEISGFCLGWPGSGLENLKGLKLRFDRRSGRRVGVWIRGACDPSEVDGAALVKLVDGMQRYAAAKLGVAGAQQRRQS